MMCVIAQSPDTYDPCQSLWLEVATSPDAPYAEIVFCSLMNVVLGYDPIGYGVPYGKQFTTDSAFSLMEAAAQAIIVLLDFGRPIAPPASEGASAGTDNSVVYVEAHDEHASGFNVFRRLLRDISDPQQLNFLFRGFSRLLNNVHKAQTTFLPNSATQISIAQELLVLLWKCLEEVPAFVPFILKENQCDVNELVVPLCFFLLQGRQDPSQLGVLYLCTFALLRLSGERSFSVALNRPYKAQLPVDMPLFKGSHADLVVITLHRLVGSGMAELSALYTCFLTVICNISPYCKTLCASAALKLVNLLELFTSPKVLFAADSNYTSVVMLLESLNNLVQYQYEGNFNLIFSILSRRRVFEWLNNFSVPAAVQDQAAVVAGDGVSPVPQLKQTPLAAAGASGDEKGDVKRQEKGQREVETDEVSAPATSSARTPVISVREEEEKEQQQEEGRGLGTQARSSDISSSLDEKVGGSEKKEKEELGEGARASSSSNGAAAGTNTGTPPQPQPQPQQQQQQQVFVPTAEWVERVRRELPLHTVMRLLRHLVPLVEELAAAGKRMDELSVLGFIRRTTMVSRARHGTDCLLD
jgi:hypothetical protein